jgi:hypothetical protein
MPVLQLNGQTLQLNGQDLYLNGSEEPPPPAPVLVTQHRGKGKKQQIYTQGPWAYR